MEEAPAAQGQDTWARDKKDRLAQDPPWTEPSSEFDDGLCLVGQRVLVQGEGEGTVRSFKKQMLASPHEIEFSGGVKQVKLRRKGNSERPWLLAPHLYSAMTKEWQLGSEPEPEPEPEPPGPAPLLEMGYDRSAC